MSVLIFGSTGQVGLELQRCADVIALGRDQADLTDPRSLNNVIRRYKPHAVINAAAYTAVDNAETDEALATVINGAAPTEMARTCAALDIPFVHVSTDYVFAGNGQTPWHPEDSVDPQNAYGRSKRIGEVGVCAAAGRYAVLRTSWVFSSHGANFVKTMLRLAETRNSLTVVSDQIGGPTPAQAIAAACLSIANQLAKDGSKSGIYHYSGAPDASWSDFATEIFAQANRPIGVAPILTQEYPTPAKRPLNSRLDCTSTQDVFGITRPDWRQGLADVLTELDARHD